VPVAYIHCFATPRPDARRCALRGIAFSLKDFIRVEKKREKIKIGTLGLETLNLHHLMECSMKKITERAKTNSRFHCKSKFIMTRVFLFTVSSDLIKVMHFFFIEESALCVFALSVMFHFHTISLESSGCVRKQRDFNVTGATVWNRDAIDSH
jgi:hypothetical protein